MQTGQLIELYSGKCLQHNLLTKLLHLGDCGEDQKLRRQKWQFEFYNPMLLNSTTKPFLTADRVRELRNIFITFNMPLPKRPTIRNRTAFWNQTLTRNLTHPILPRHLFP